MGTNKSDLAMRLHAAAIHLLRTVRVEDRRAELSPARLSVLSILVFAGPRSLTQLTDAEQVAAPTMTKLVAGLEKDGYVRRKPHPLDGRAWIIQATAKARKTLLDARQRRVDLLAKLLADVSPPEWKTLEAAVDTIERRLRAAAEASS
jgi:DNA-binding MarR family transcriptional regulator